MPDLDELEHDTHDDTKRRGRRARSRLPKAKPKSVSPTVAEPRSERRRDIKQAAGRTEKKWCSIDNPAIWSGDEDDE